MTNYNYLQAREYWSNRRINNKPLQSVTTMSSSDSDCQKTTNYEIDLLKSIIDFKGKKVLDVACGVGRIGNPLSDICDIYGQDLSEEMLKDCKFKTKQGSIDKLQFDDEYFDIVLCLGILEHIPYDMRKICLSEIYRVLKPKGESLILVNNPDNKELKEYSLKVQNPEQHFDKYEGYFCLYVDSDKIDKDLKKLSFKTKLVNEDDCLSIIVATKS